MISKSIFCGIAFALLASSSVEAGSTHDLLAAANDAPLSSTQNDTIVPQKSRALQKQESIGSKYGHKVSKSFDPSSIKVNPFDDEDQEEGGYYRADRLTGEDRTLHEEYYKSRKWYNDIFIGAGFGINNIAPLAKVKYNPTSTYNVYAGYQFQSKRNISLHALRLSAGFGHYMSKELPESMWGIDLGLDYMFNATAYIDGLNPKRRIDVSPVFGVGYVMMSNSQWTSHSWRPRFGLNVDYKLMSNSHIFAEPYIFVINDNFDHSGLNPRVYDVHWGFQAGVRIDLNNDKTGPKLYAPYFNPNPFYDFSLGFNGYWMGNVGTSLRRSMGGNYQVSVGRWMHPAIGARAAAHIGDFYWRGEGVPPKGYGNTQIHPGVATFHRGIVGGGRLEFMVQPLNFFPKWRRNQHDFELDLFYGFEFGMYGKGHVPTYGRLTTFYVGRTGGFDFLYKIAPGTSIFIEPRFLLSDFSVRKAYRGHEGNFTDKLASLNVGLRLQRPNIPEREAFFAGEPEQGFELGVTAGSTKFIRKCKIQASYPFNWNAGLGLTYHFDAYHGVMLEAEYNRLNKQYPCAYEISSGTNMMRYTGYMTSKMNYVVARLAYRLNLSTLFLDSSWRRRRFNLYMVMGPTYSRQLKTGHELVAGEIPGGTGKPHFYTEKLEGRSGWGVFGGFIASYSLTKDLSVNIRPEGHFISSNHFLGIDAVRYATVLKVNAGLEWKF